MFRLPFPKAAFLVPASPNEYWLRSIVLILISSYFAVLSLQLFRFTSTGCCLILHPRRLLSLKVRPPRAKLTSSENKSGYRLDRFSPVSTALLGLILFAAAQFFLVMIFKRLDYSF